MDLKHKRMLSNEDLDRLIYSKEWDRLHDMTTESMILQENQWGKRFPP